MEWTSFRPGKAGGTAVDASVARHMRSAMLFGAIYSLSQALILVILRPLGLRTLLGLQLSFFADPCLQTLQGWETAGLLPRYQAHLLPDFVHPVWYSVALVSTLAALFNANGIGGRWKTLLAVPLVAGGCDVLENTFQVILLAYRSSPAIAPPVILASGLVSTLKWGFSAVSILAVTLLLGRHLLRRIHPLAGLRSRLLPRY